LDGTKVAANSEILYSLGVALIFVGMIIILISLTLLLVRSVKGTGKMKGGGAIIIGPFPIVFGTDKESLKTVLWLALALTIIVLVAMALLHLILK
jgi:uncharacterized protein (TIGR00304 family)